VRNVPNKPPVTNQQSADRKLAEKKLLASVRAAPQITSHGRKVLKGSQVFES
jgi:hypothetical protein